MKRSLVARHLWSIVEPRLPTDVRWCRFLVIVPPGRLRVATTIIQRVLERAAVSANGRIFWRRIALTDDVSIPQCDTGGQLGRTLPCDVGAVPASVATGHSAWQRVDASATTDARHGGDAGRACTVCVFPIAKHQRVNLLEGTNTVSFTSERAHKCHKDDHHKDAGNVRHNERGMEVGLLRKKSE